MMMRGSDGVAVTGDCGGDIGGAHHHAHQLSKLRVNTSSNSNCNRPAPCVTSPVTPATPVAVTPSFFNLAAGRGWQDESLHQDLQLAAELGKTLLERNKALEGTIQQQERVGEEHVLEIEYLSKQTAALREVNDSRLQIYEQLEISVADLEKANQGFRDDADCNKRKIRNLSSTIEALEGRIDELQRSLEDARHAAVAAAAVKGRDSDELEEGKEEQKKGNREETQDDGQDLNQELLSQLRNEIQDIHKKLGIEADRREQAECQLSAMAEDYHCLQEQSAILQEQQECHRTLDEELKDLDASTSSQRYCTKCMDTVDDTGSSPTVFDLGESFDEDPVSTPSQRGQCALVRLKNGAMAWGSQESLASMGQIVSQGNSSVTSPEGNIYEVPQNSICSEFKTQYLNLIDKYEKLTAAAEEREEQIRQQKNLQQTEDDHATFLSSDPEEMSGPMSLVLSHDTTCPPTMKCQRCANCSCGITGAQQRPKSNMEEYSEVETSSSGFSEGESRLINKTTQTEYLQGDKLEEVTPTEFVVTFARFLDLKSPVNPCDQRFKSTPEYKKLFHEIFTVLKETVHANESKCEPNKTGSTTKVIAPSVTSTNDDIGLDNEFAALTMESSSTKTVCTTSNSVSSTPSGKHFSKKEVVNMLKNASNALNTEIDRKSPASSNVPDRVCVKTLEESSNILKPLRPNSLDLLSNASSRSSSKNRRRRSKQKNRKSIEPQKQNVKDEQINSEVSSTIAVSTVSDVQQTTSPVSTVSPVDLCTKHRQHSNKKKNRRNRSRNGNLQLPRNSLQSENIKPQLSNCSLGESPTHTKGKNTQSLTNERPLPRMQESRKSDVRNSTDPRRNSNQRRIQYTQQIWSQPQKSQTDYHQHQKEHSNYQSHRRDQIVPPAPPASANNLLPSAQIAQLRSLDQTYADVLKQMPNFKTTRRVVR